MFTVKKEKFVEEYLVDANATQAAVRAGYSKRTAYSQGQRLLKDVEVENRIAKARQARAERVGMTTDEVLKEIGIVAFSDVQRYVIDNQGNVQLAAGVPEGAMRAVASIKKKIIPLDKGGYAYETEVRLWNKPAALKMAGEHLGMFAPEKKKDSDQQQHANNYFLALVQIVQQHGLNSTAGREKFRSDPSGQNEEVELLPVVKNGPKHGPISPND
jgi:phage terminase small subunit